MEELTQNALRMEFVTVQDLLKRPDLVTKLVKFVNQTYTDSLSYMFVGTLRFANEEHMLAELGSVGLLAILCKMDIEDPAATAFVRSCDDPLEGNAATFHPFPSYRYPLDVNERNFEIFAVCTATAYQHQGLPIKLLHALESRLLSQQPSTTIAKFWMAAVDECTGDYWRRKGYTQIGEVYSKPKGTWNSLVDFHVIKLVKTITKSDPFIASL